MCIYIYIHKCNVLIDFIDEFTDAYCMVKLLLALRFLLPTAGVLSMMELLHHRMLVSSAILYQYRVVVYINMS